MSEETTANYDDAWKDALSTGLPEQTNSEASAGFPLSKGDGRGIKLGFRPLTRDVCTR